MKNIIKHIDAGFTLLFYMPEERETSENLKVEGEVDANDAKRLEK
jgi:hypothetical protein